jgi:hypothetical protein
MELKKLTIGTVVHDDYDGLYFSLQAIRLYHPEILERIEFIIIDNNPESAHGSAAKKLINWIKEPIQYVPFTEYKSTAIRTKIFELAKTEYVLCMDCHVLFTPGSLKKLIDFYDSNQDNNNLLQGPMIYDDCINFASHFSLIWRGQMWGVWDTDERGKDPNGAPFEIPAMGLGVFTCRKNAWLGFNTHFRGFGGEEGYIHEKYRQAGRKTLCLPFLRWMHRFGRPNGVTYPLTLENKIRNYILGFTELNLNIDPIKEHFSNVYSAEKFELLREKIYREINHE